MLNCSNYQYNSAGDITGWTQQTDSNAPGTYGYGYDGADELLRVAKTSGTNQSLIDAYAYRYDAAGTRPVEQIDTAVNTASFNSLNQLTSRTGGGILTISGSLSEPGTVTIAGQSQITGSTSTTFSLAAPVNTGSNSIPITAVDASNNSVSKTLKITVTGTSAPQLQYDPDGNLTSDGTNSYEWDAANRLTAVNEPGKLRSEFAYDGLGRRVRITEKSNGIASSVKNLIWDGMQIAEARNKSNTLTNRYFMQGMQMNGGSFYYTRDHLGSIREMIDTNGVIVARYDYDPLGRRTKLPSGAPDADFGFTGDYYHQPSGLCLAPYREYAPGLGRWLSRDPIGERGGTNLYVYVRNNPIMLIDPLGLTDFNALQTQNYLNQAYTDAVAGPEQGLSNIFHNSTGRFDFKLNQPDDTFCVNGHRMTAPQFGNYIAGFAGKAYDQTYSPFGLPVAEAAVKAGGIAYHLGDGFPPPDPLDKTGFPDINNGENAAPGFLGAPAPRNGKCGCN